VKRNNREEFFDCFIVVVVVVAIVVECFFPSKLYGSGWEFTKLLTQIRKILRNLGP